jgi:putative endonuclease
MNQSLLRVAQSARFMAGHREREEGSGSWPSCTVTGAQRRFLVQGAMGTDMDPLVHCVYVLFSRRDGELYIGFSSNLVQRLNSHANGEVPSTAPRRPFVLVHVEYYRSEADARRREDYLKTTKGKRALKLMLPDSLGLLRVEKSGTAV